MPAKDDTAEAAATVTYKGGTTAKDAETALKDLKDAEAAVEQTVGSPVPPSPETPAGFEPGVENVATKTVDSIREHLFTEADNAAAKGNTQRAEQFRDEAPVTAEQAAQIILDGVREERWRILVDVYAVGDVLLKRLYERSERVIRDCQNGALRAESR